jgi:hypothetical protein
MARLSRAELLRRGSRGGAVFLIAGPTAALAPAEARAATSDNDLAYARLLVAAELLAIDFYRHALAKDVDPRATRELRRSLADERKHYRGVAAILLAAGETPATAADIDFVYRGARSPRALGSPPSGRGWRRWSSAPTWARSPASRRAGSRSRPPASPSTRAST